MRWAAFILSLFLVLFVSFSILRSKPTHHARLKSSLPVKALTSLARTDPPNDPRKTFADAQFDSSQIVLPIESVMPLLKVSAFLDGTSRFNPEICAILGMSDEDTKRFQAEIQARIVELNMARDCIVSDTNSAEFIVKPAGDRAINSVLDMMKDVPLPQDKKDFLTQIITTSPYFHRNVLSTLTVRQSGLDNGGTLVEIQYLDEHDSVGLAGGMSFQFSGNPRDHPDAARLFENLPTLRDRIMNSNP
jgi:hypothetical protein